MTEYSSFPDLARKQRCHSVQTFGGHDGEKISEKDDKEIHQKSDEKKSLFEKEIFGEEAGTLREHSQSPSPGETWRKAGPQKRRCRRSEGRRLSQSQKDGAQTDIKKIKS